MGGLWKDPAQWCWKWVSNEGKVGIKDPACLGLSCAGAACARAGFGGRDQVGSRGYTWVCPWEDRGPGVWHERDGGALGGTLSGLHKTERRV